LQLCCSVLQSVVVEPSLCVFSFSLSLGACVWIMVGVFVCLIFPLSVYMLKTVEVASLSVLRLPLTNTIHSDTRRFFLLS